MKKFAASLCVVLTLTLGIALAPTLSLAAEFSYDGQPAFTVTYPKDFFPDKLSAPNQVWGITRIYSGLLIRAFISPIPEGVELKDVAEKAYKPVLEKNVGATAKMSDNKEITLSDGTKAYYSELFWKSSSIEYPILTVMVSVYKDGKWVYIVSHPPSGFQQDPIKIVKSLRFK